MPSRAASQAKVDPVRFRRAPLAFAALAFSSGIALGRDSPQPVRVILAGLFLLLLLTLAAGRWARRVTILPVLGVWVILGMAALSWQPAPDTAFTLTPFADDLSRTVRGRIIRVRQPAPVAIADSDTDPVPAWEQTEDPGAEHGRPVSIDLQLDAIEDVTPDISRMVPAAGGVRVSIYAGPTDGVSALSCGEILEMPLRLRLPDRFRDPGVFQAADFLAAQGIAAQGSAAVEDVALIGNSPPSFACRLQAVQGWAAQRMLGFAGSRENRHLPPGLRLSTADAAMLNAMLFGDRSSLTHDLRAGFERTGSFHLFVVSGLHVALLAAAVFWAARRLRAPLWLATLLTLLAAIAYAAVTGFGQPAQRALIMTAVFLLARLLSRDRDLLNALGAAVLAMLVWNPRSLFDASLQMTVLAMLAIGGIAVPLGQRSFLHYARVTRHVFTRRRALLTRQEQQFRLMLELWGETLIPLLGRWSRMLPSRLVHLLLWILELALIGTVAELVMVLPMAAYFHRAAVFALPVNMLVIPLIGLLVPAAVATFTASLLNGWLAILPGAVTGLLLHAVSAGIGRVSRLALADVRVPGPVWWVGLLALAGWFFCCWAVRCGRWGAWLATVLLPAIALMVLWPEPVVRTPGALEMTAIDVGQGDSLLAVSPEGQTMLIDAGGPVGRHGNAEVVTGFDVGEEVVSPYLWTRRLRRLDVAVLTHAHTDHMGGMAAVLRNFRPRELWVGVEVQSPLYATLLEEASRLGITVRHIHAGQSFALGSVAVKVLAPAVGYRNSGAPRNDDSVVLRMEYGQSSVLLEGDAERASEDAMLAAGLVTPVTLLKVGHHGSRTSSNPEFLAAAAPREAVISVGRRNTFGHPRGEVIQRFAERGVRLFRTDRMGLTTFLLTPDGTVREVVDGVALPGPLQRLTPR